MYDTSGAHCTAATKQLHERRNPAVTRVLFIGGEVEQHIGFDEGAGWVVNS